MRGRLSANSLTAAGERNTPAYAGKTEDLSDAIDFTKKHPRVCGEDPWSDRSWLKSEETPPRMRGRPGMID